MDPNPTFSERERAELVAQALVGAAMRLQEFGPFWQLVATREPGLVGIGQLTDIAARAFVAGYVDYRPFLQALGRWELACQAHVRAALGRGGVL